MGEATATEAEPLLVKSLDKKPPTYARSGSVLVYGEIRHDADNDDGPVAATTQIDANYAWIAAFGMLGTCLRLGLGAGAGDSPWTLGLLGPLWANALGCFFYGVFARTWLSVNTPAIYAGLTTGFCGCLTTFSAWAIATAEHACRGHVVRTVLTIVVPFFVGQGMLELGIFAGDMLERRGVIPSALRPGDVDVDEEIEKGEIDVDLPLYDALKLPLGTGLLVCFLVTAIVLVCVGPGWVVVPAAAAALTPLGAWLRYGLGRLNMGGRLPWGTLAANALGTVLDATFILLMVATAGSDPFLQALVDGFCAGLSTASTFTSEFRMLNADEPLRHRAYVYAALTFLIGQVLSVPLIAARPYV